MFVHRHIIVGDFRYTRQRNPTDILSFHLIFIRHIFRIGVSEIWKIDCHFFPIRIQYHFIFTLFSFYRWDKWSVINRNIGDLKSIRILFSIIYSLGICIKYTLRTPEPQRTVSSFLGRTTQEYRSRNTICKIIRDKVFSFIITEQSVTGPDP